jgi:hypothetical protein
LRQKSSGHVAVSAFVEVRTWKFCRTYSVPQTRSGNPGRNRRQTCAFLPTDFYQEISCPKINLLEILMFIHLWSNPTP